MFTALGITILILFAITAAGVVPCGAPKKSPRTPFMVKIIFSVLSFEISGDIVRTQISILCLDIFSNRHMFGPIWIILVFVSTSLLKGAKLQYFPLASYCQIYRATDLTRLK